MFCSPDEGAAAAVLCRADIAHRYTLKPIYLKATTLRTRTYGAYEVHSSWAAVEADVAPTVYASRAAYEMAGVGPGAGLAGMGLLVADILLPIPTSFAEPVSINLTLIERKNGLLLKTKMNKNWSNAPLTVSLFKMVTMKNASLQVIVCSGVWWPCICMNDMPEGVRGFLHESGHVL
jgi:hypothetical protein